MNRRLVALVVLAIAGCALYSDVTIVPLSVQPANIDHPSDLTSMIRKADLVRAVQLAPTIEAKHNRSAQDLAALGSAEMISGRYDDARRHLRAAIDLAPFRTTYSTIAWDLSPLDEARQNKTKGATGIIASGAVPCIISQHPATQLGVKPFGDFQGTFTGLLGEPIPVHFALLDSMELGDMIVSKVPIAIMADEKMKFFITGKKEFRIDLLIGTNFLKEFRTALAFRRTPVTFPALTSADRHPSPDQNVFIEAFRPAVRGTINRHGWFMFILDTGSEVTFLNEKHIEDLPIQLLAPKVHSAMLQGLGGAQKHGPKVENVEVGFDKWAGVFHNLPMYDSNEADRTAGIVGENYLRNFIVTLDFGKMRLDLTPINPFVTNPDITAPGKAQLPPS